MAKTTIAGWLSQAMGLEELYVFSVDGQSEENDLTIEYQSNPKAGETFTDSNGNLHIKGAFYKKIQPFLQKFSQNNQMIMIDEINLNGDLFHLFKSIAQGADKIYLDIPGKQTQLVQRGKNVHICLSMNEANDENFSQRFEEDKDLYAEFVIIRFSDHYTREEDIIIDAEKIGLQTTSLHKKMHLSPPTRKKN